MFPRRLFMVCATLLFAVPSWAQTVPMPDGTKLIILRHGDRTDEDLNERGIARAQALVGALEGIEIDHIFSLSLPRNLDTAKPLSVARGLPVEKITSLKPARVLMERGGGKTIVWVGNKWNLKSIWTDLAAPGVAPLEYGDLFIVTPGPKVERRRVEIPE